MIVRKSVQVEAGARKCVKEYCGSVKLVKRKSDVQEEASPSGS